MLELNNIVREYRTGDTTIRALDGVSVKFRKNEFVSVLGPSGCGKTTLLNVLGGLDRYDSGGHEQHRAADGRHQGGLPHVHLRHGVLAGIQLCI